MERVRERKGTHRNAGSSSSPWTRSGSVPGKQCAERLLDHSRSTLLFCTQRHADRIVLALFSLKENKFSSLPEEVNMRGRHAVLMIQMSQQTRTTLQGWLQRQKTPLGRAKRARSMLLLEQGHSYAQTAKWVGLTERNLRKWAKRFHNHRVVGLDEKSRPGRTPVFSPEVALYIVKLACERPDRLGRSLSQWDCPELAHKLKADGIVETISPETVGRILRSHKLKPWRYHLWLPAKVPRDGNFAYLVHTLVELYTRPLTKEEMVLCVDEKTNLQPRPRLARTLPTRPGSPIRLEHEYKRAGALHLFAAFDTWNGKVYARTEMRKWQIEFIAFLSQLEQELPVAKTRVYLVIDNLKMK